MKRGRVVGIDDGYFERGKHTWAPLVGTVMKGPVVEAFLLGRIEVDGQDATERIAELVEPYREQIGALMLYGTVFGGTNIVDVKRLYGTLKRPVLVVVDKKPEEERLLTLFERLGKGSLYRSNPLLEPVRTRRGTLFASWVGMGKGEALNLLRSYQWAGKVPEPLRLSHLLGKVLGRWRDG